MSTSQPRTGLPMNEEEQDFYRQSLDMARRQLSEIDSAIERELSAVRERIGTLQDKRRVSLQMYEAACTMLGEENEFAAPASPDEDSGKADR